MGHACRRIRGRYPSPVIVVVGAVHAQDRAGVVEPGGLTARIAVGAAAAGRPVELVSRVGDDPAGDAVLLGLARAGVRHVATLRDGGRATTVAAVPEDGVDPLDDGVVDGEGTGRTSDLGAALDRNDLGLALRYLPEISVIVLVHPTGRDVLAEALDGARYAGAHLVVVASPADGTPDTPPGAALVIEAPPDADAVGELIGRYAAAVDGGTTPADAFASTFAVDA